jgi:hypothetical protein
MSNHISKSTKVAIQNDPRFINFYDAYVELGCEDPGAQYRAQERIREDDDALFTVCGCTNFSTAKAAILLMEAVTMLNAGDLHNADALQVIEMAVKSIKEAR